MAVVALLVVAATTFASRNICVGLDSVGDKTATIDGRRGIAVGPPYCLIETEWIVGPLFDTLKWRIIDNYLFWRYMLFPRWYVFIWRAEGDGPLVMIPSFALAKNPLGTENVICPKNDVFIRLAS